MKINIQKPVYFLYTNKELTEKELRKAILFAVASINILSINLTKDV
jgi:hypothetical protein